MNSTELIVAHAHSTDHRRDVEKSKICGCFYCKKTFAPQDIVEWIDDNQTALCPYCGIDAVVPDTLNDITDEFLEEMSNYWFAVSNMLKRAAELTKDVKVNLDEELPDDVEF